MKMLLRAAIALAAAVSTLPAGAQMTYSFSQSTAAYAPLPNNTASLNNGQVWDDNKIFSAPIGFSFKHDGKTISRFWMKGTDGFMNDSTGLVSGFSFLGAYSVDRGLYGGVSKSPVRYQTTGTTPNRIFKFELRNMGFADENMNYGTMDDSASVQIWLYETSNVVEFRYGASSLVHFGDYFEVGPAVGLGKKINLSSQGMEKAYILNGSPANPAVDSVTPASFNKGLTGMPANGTVYRFTPKGNGPTAVHNADLQASLRVFPTQCSNTLNIQSLGSEPVQYEIISATGSSLLNGNIQNGTDIIDVGSLAPGTYLVRLNSKEAQDIRRIVKL